MKIWVLSFGSDLGYVHLSNRVCTNITKSYPGSNILIYTADDLPESLKDRGVAFTRGFGYWIWKPYIVKKTLEMASEGDILLYVDGRSGASGKKIAWFDDFIARADVDMVVQKLRHTERAWSTGDLMNLFGFDMNAEAATSAQFAATFFALRVNDRTRRVIGDWFLIMDEKYDLCRDEPSKMENHESFVENRHDQSVFSLTLKRAMASGLRTAVITKKQIDGSLVPHFSPRPGEKIKISRRIKMLISMLS